MINQIIGYDELLKKYEELVKENGILSAENHRLKQLLEGINNNSSSFIKNTSFSTSLSYHIIEEQGSISFTPNRNNSTVIKEGILPFSEYDSHFICRRCHKIPIIEFNSLRTFNTSCLCTKNQNIPLLDIIKEYVVRDKEESINDNNNIERYLKCILHNKNFVYYCKYDYTHLCRTCIKQNSSFHQIHFIYNFDFYFFEINQKKNQIIKILNEKQGEMSLEFDY